MKAQDAKNQLCKMAGEIAERIGEYSTCVCGQEEQTDPYEIPDEVIEEMWRRLTHPTWLDSDKPAPVKKKEARCYPFDGNVYDPFWGGGEDD